MANVSEHDLDEVAEFSRFEPFESTTLVNKISRATSKESEHESVDSEISAINAP